jgi:hypothetical protein
VAVRQAARQYVIEHFDAETICVPQLRRLLEVGQRSEQERRAQSKIPAELTGPEPSPEPREDSQAVTAQKRTRSAADMLRNPFAS